MPTNPSPPYSIEKQAGFFKQRENELTKLFYYQPTPEGVMLLCEHYARKYKINLECVDLRGRVEVGDNAYFFFKYLQENPSLLAIEEGQSRGLLLSHGQHHVIPVLVHREAGDHHIIVFDSSSGPRIKGYFKMAALFPDSQFYLNDGTRQSDEGSCITDAICILKEALQIETLISCIQSRAILEHPAFIPSRFLTTPKPENFHVFRMPESLLLTAQISKYLEEADANQDVIIRGGQSLGEYRKHFSMEIILFKKGEEIPANINGYLYVKSLEHENILDAYLCDKQLELNEAIEKDPIEKEAIEKDPIEIEIPFEREPPFVSLSPSNLSFYSITDPGKPAPGNNFRHLNFSR